MWIDVEIWQHTFKMRRRGSSGSIVSNYGLDDRAIGVRSPAGANNFSCSLCVQTNSEANPASCTMGTGGPSPGAKRGPGVTLTTNPHLVPRSRSRSYISSPPPSATKSCSGTALLLPSRWHWEKELSFSWHNGFTTEAVGPDVSWRPHDICCFVVRGPLWRNLRTTKVWRKTAYRNCIRPWYIPWKI
jgi:hypothetical protein